MSSKEAAIQTAEFDRRVRHYWLLSGSLILLVTFVGIPLLPIWWILGLGLTERYLQTMSCTLTDRSLKFKKGILVRTEKTVPLDKITDLGFVQGPIMRYFDLESISVETAGQSGPGSLISAIGIKNAREFRDLVMKQREIYLHANADENQAGSRIAASSNADDQSHLELLTDIRDTLARIEQNLP